MIGSLVPLPGPEYSMTIARLTLVALLLAGLSPARQASAASRGSEQGPFLGVLFSPVAEAQFVYTCQRFARPFLGCLAGPADLLTETLPPLQGMRGVVVTQVLPDSPADKCGLKRGDILLCYNNASIQDCRSLAQLIQADKPDNKVRLRFVRDRREATVEVKLALGPVLRLAPAYSAYKKDNADGPRATNKPRMPSSVSVAVRPLMDGKMKVIIEYYEKETGKLCTVTCQGNNEEIKSEVNRLPARERDLVTDALERLRTSRSQKRTDR
jgi:hypothetical protein